MYALENTHYPNLSPAKILVSEERPEANVDQSTAYLIGNGALSKICECVVCPTASVPIKLYLFNFISSLDSLL